MPDPAVLTELAFTRSLAEQTVRGREETINQHLVKLLAFDASEALRRSWKREPARKHFALLGKIRVKPDRRPLSARNFLDWLYADPFEGNEVGYVEALVGLNSDRDCRNDRSTAAIATRLADLYGGLAERRARGETGADLADAL